MADEVTIRLTKDELSLLDAILGIAHGASTNDRDMVRLIVHVANRVNANNPNWTPFEIAKSQEKTFTRGLDQVAEDGMRLAAELGGRKWTDIYVLNVLCAAAATVCIVHDCKDWLDKPLAEVSGLALRMLKREQEKWKGTNGAVSSDA